MCRLKTAQKDREKEEADGIAGMCRCPQQIHPYINESFSQAINRVSTEKHCEINKIQGFIPFVFLAGSEKCEYNEKGESK